MDKKKPPLYKRVLIKISGESLIGKGEFGIDSERLEQYVREMKNIIDNNIEVAVVIGGGNIFRGMNANQLGIDRVQGDYME